MSLRQSGAAPATCSGERYAAARSSARTGSKTRAPASVSRTAWTLQLGMLPWTGPTLLYTLFFGALLGLVTVILAIKGTWRPLFFVWSLVVTLLLLKGYIFSRYHRSEERRVGKECRSRW